MILVLQFRAEDMDHAEDVVRLMAQLEKSFRSDVQLLLAMKKGTPSVQHIIDMASQKFEVLTFTNRTAPDGWPQGPNYLWSETMMHVLTHTFPRVKVNALKYPTVFLMEPDGCPLRPDWIDKLKLEEARMYAEHKACCGFLSDKGGEGEHINGNMLLSMEALRKNQKLLGSPHRWPWDFYHKGWYVSNGLDSRYIISRYNSKNMDESMLFMPRDEAGEIPAYMHGVKDDSARQLVRKKWGL